jgi:hypothetical protein
MGGRRGNHDGYSNQLYATIMMRAWKCWGFLFSIVVEWRCICGLLSFLLKAERGCCEILGFIATINILGACATIDHGSKSATQVVSALLLNNLLKHDNIRVH